MTRKIDPVVLPFRIHLASQLSSTVLLTRAQSHVITSDLQKLTIPPGGIALVTSGSTGCHCQSRVLNSAYTGETVWPQASSQRPRLEPGPRARS